MLLDCEVNSRPIVGNVIGTDLITEGRGWLEVEKNIVFFLQMGVHHLPLCCLNMRTSIELCEDSHFKGDVRTSGRQELALQEYSLGPVVCPLTDTDIQ